VVNENTIAIILNNLNNYQIKLATLTTYPRKKFLDDFTKVESAKHLLQVSIQSCLDMAQHIIADAGYRVAQDSYDTFVVLNEEQIIPDDFMPSLRKMVSFRNRVVHLYWDVNDDIIYDLIQNNLEDFKIFTAHILNYIQQDHES
jgi:uncharacterized protein YutE (UPF0331/DUF86 family)